MDDRSHPFRDSQQDRKAADQVPSTPQSESPTYRLAFVDGAIKEHGGAPHQLQVCAAGCGCSGGMYVCVCIGYRMRRCGFGW